VCICGALFASAGVLHATPPQRALSQQTDSIAAPTDTIPALTTDSIPKKNNAIDAPIQYTSKDSTVMLMTGGNRMFMYGEAVINYTNLELKAENIVVNADSSIVTATTGIDSIGDEFGFPTFKQGDTQYEFRRARYNFKTKRLASTDIITEQNDGYITAGRAKKLEHDEMFMEGGRFTTCDEHDHPHYYFQMSKAMVEKDKRVVFGPTYLVMEDVPLPVAVPFGFFPFSKDYASGVLMPTYDDEMKRGFGLREGGYYFAINDYVDLAVRGEVYTRGSWGINATSNYRKRYKFSGNFNASYLVTKIGDLGDPDYSKTKDMRLVWSHSQDAKANPYGTFSASVNFSTSSYDHNELNSLMSGNYTQNTKASSVNYSYRPPNSPFSFSANASVNQISRDTTLSMTLPNFTATMRDIYPFRRKEQIGAPRWYENIRMSYSGTLSNSISNVKESEFLKQNLIKDWKNAVRHTIPVSASFNLFKAITITPSVNYNERWYFSKIDQYYNAEAKRIAPVDTTYGFYRIYDYSASVSANTKLYGMYKFWSMFGKWTEKTQIRHVFTPSISFSGAPDFSKDKYGYYKSAVFFDEQKGKMDTVRYSPFSHNMYGVPGSGSSGSMSFSFDNNLEMKVPVADTDSTKKVSLIDNLNFGTSYNFLADSLNWSDLRASIRFKIGGTNLSLQGAFDMYEYGANGRPVNKLRLGHGGIPRLKSTGTSYSYTINNATFAKWFGKKENEDDKPAGGSDAKAFGSNDADGTTLSTDQSSTTGPATTTSLHAKKKSDSDLDADGYYKNGVPWNLSFNYSLSVNYGTFDENRREYNYRYNQSLGISGNISPTKNWNLTFSTNYDFDQHKFATMNCSITRKMHCWNMSASFIPIGPYQSYSFTVAISSALLKDLKYQQSSNYRDAGKWGNNY
jgi:lipopolysaccharide assembly outer membrane protein LptD (OstA)